MAGPDGGEYGEVLLDHFENPRNVGEVPSPDAQATVKSPVHGDTVRLTFRVGDGRIAEARFRALGCPVTIASASLATEILTGATIEQALALTNREIARRLGGVPPERMRCSLLVEEALRTALGAL